MLLESCPSPTCFDHQQRKEDSVGFTLLCGSVLVTTNLLQLLQPLPLGIVMRRAGGVTH